MISPTGDSLSNSDSEQSPHHALRGGEKECISDASPRWYVVRCPSGKKLYEALTLCMPVDSIYWPQTLKPQSESRKEYLSPIVKQYVFIHTEADRIKTLFNERGDAHGLGWPMHESGDIDRLIAVPDKQMERFRWFCENNSDELILMHDPFFKFSDGMKVRVRSGSMKGREGVLTKYKHHNNFVFDMGSMAVMVKSLSKWDFEVIGDSLTARQRYSVIDLIDRLQEYIDSPSFGTIGNALGRHSSEILAELLLYNIYKETKDNDSVSKKYCWMRSSEARSHTVKPAEILFPDEDDIEKVMDRLKKYSQVIEIISHFVISQRRQLLETFERPDLTCLCRKESLRPFITRSCVAYNEEKPVIVSESRCDVAVKVDHEGAEYFANIALFGKDGGILAITNWSPCKELINKSKENQSFSLTLLCKVRDEKDRKNIHLAEYADIYGTAMFLPNVSLQTIKTSTTPIADSLATLISTSISICDEIWRSTYYSLRTQLQRVFIRACAEK